MEDMVIGVIGALAHSHVGVDFKDEHECVILLHLRGTKRAVQVQVMKHVVVQIIFAKVW